MMSRKRDLLIDGAHLFVLSNLAFAQPLYDLLGRNAEFFVARGSEPVDIFLLVVGLSLLTPAIFALTEGLAGLLGHRVRKGLHYVWVSVLVTISLLPPLKSLDVSTDRWLVLAGVVSGVAAALGYWRFKPLRSPFALGVIVLAGLVFPVKFMFVSPVSKVLIPKGVLSIGAVDFNATAPVVMVIFDELPVTSLMDEQGLIDPDRYPNFAALAKDAHWYRAATTPVEDTLRSVPAILSGLTPSRTRDKRLPTAADFPHTLFTLLAGAYELEVSESVTQLCPEDLCGGGVSEGMFKRLSGLLEDLSIVYLHIIGPSDLTSKLPEVTQNWSSFARGQSSYDAAPAAPESESNPKRFARFLRSIDASDEPTLYFLHVLLPHVPWKYLPSGKQYTKTTIPGLNLAKDKWGQDEWLVLQGYQRHLLQVGFVDKLVGELLDKLHSLGMYDRSLIVLTADHGVNFRASKPRRRVVEEFPREIKGVPLLIKEPGQKSGSVEDFDVQTIDVLPTIADILDIPMPWALDGQSMHGRRNSGSSRFDPLAYAPLARKIAQFGSRSGSGGLLNVGPYKDLVGRDVDAVGVAGEATTGITIDQAPALANVDLESAVVPSRITGRVLGGGNRNSKLDLAISVNGAIQAMTRTYWARRREQFAAMVPESALQHGANNVEVFVVSAVAGGVALKRCKSDAAPVYALSLARGHDVAVAVQTSVVSGVSEKVHALVASDGRSMRLVRGVMRGFVKSSVQDELGRVVFSGWAADVENGELPEEIVMFASGKFMRAGKTNMERLDLVKKFGDKELLWAGFHWSLPLSELGPPGAAEVRFFAVSKNGLAVELNYSVGFDYGKQVIYLLEEGSQGEETLITEEGRTILIVPGAVGSALDVSVKGGRVVFRGWAADTAYSEVARAIVIFVNGQCVHAGEPNEERPGLVKRLGGDIYRWAGFRFDVPAGTFENLDHSEIRLFAVSARGLASEFRYGADYPWGRRTSPRN